MWELMVSFSKDQNYASFRNQMEVLQMNKAYQREKANHNQESH